jgi:hypothetical protein
MFIPGLSLGATFAGIAAGPECLSVGKGAVVRAGALRAVIERPKPVTLTDFARKDRLSMMGLL